MGDFLPGSGSTEFVCLGHFDGGGRHYQEENDRSLCYSGES